MSIEKSGHFVPMGDLKLKIRTAQIDGERFITANIWLDGEPRMEVARLRIDFAGEPSGELYVAWQDLMKSMFKSSLEQITGLKCDEIRLKARQPSYEGE